MALQAHHPFRIELYMLYDHGKNRLPPAPLRLQVEVAAFAYFFRLLFRPYDVVTVEDDHL